jgi:hypothetical protein
MVKTAEHYLNNPLLKFTELEAFLAPKLWDRFFKKVWASFYKESVLAWYEFENELRREFTALSPKNDYKSLFADERKLLKDFFCKTYENCKARSDLNFLETAKEMVRAKCRELLQTDQKAIDDSKW